MTSFPDTGGNPVDKGMLFILHLYIYTIQYTKYTYSDDYEDSTMLN